MEWGGGGGGGLLEERGEGRGGRLRKGKTYSIKEDAELVELGEDVDEKIDGDALATSLLRVVGVDRHVGNEVVRDDYLQSHHHCRLPKRHSKVRLGQR